MTCTNLNGQCSLSRVFELVKYSLRFKILVADLDVSMCKMCLRYIQICDKSYGTEGVVSYG
jgi:hypothetical protein